MNDKQSKELEEKLELFENHINYSIELNKESDKESIENGNYSYLIEPHCIQVNTELSEELEEVLSKSTIDKKMLIEKAIEDGHFKMKYEELSSPFQYGGAKENEFYCLPWGGDRECQIDRDKISEFLTSFNLKDLFENYKEFEDYVNFNIGRNEYLKVYWDFSTSSLTHAQVTYNTDYDIVRCIIDDENSLIEFLNEHKKPEVKLVRKKLKLVLSDYNNLRNSYDGFCVKCGKINEGNHEPDAEKYECSHCETRNSFGIEFLLMSGDVEIVDSEDESNLDESY